MIFEKRNISEIESVVRDVFHDDEKLFSEYHVINGTEEECVRHTVSQIKEAGELGRLKLYVSGFGFALVLGDILYSFGIKKSERSIENKEKFLNFVKSHCSRCYLWSKNIRARRFLVNNGFHEVFEEDFDGNKFVELCQ